MFSRMIATLLSSLLLCLWAITGTPAQQAAPSFDAAQQQDVQKNPPGVTFTLILADGRMQFHTGERIPLNLAFSSSLPGKYKLDVRLYDRVGRLNFTEFYHVDRPGDTVDPLADYFDDGLISMGGISAMPPTLNVKPYVITRDLNEWRRFDKPGRYRLYVTSGRLNPDIFIRRGAENLTITSNVIAFDILPDDPAWDEATLQAAVKTLSAPDKTNTTGISAHNEAARTLRFLGTQDAIREMARRQANQSAPEWYECRLGLWSAPDRAFVVGEMKRLLQSPEFAVTDSFVDDLARLESYAENPTLLPPYSSDPQKVAQYQAQSMKRLADIAARRARYTALLKTLVGDKQRGARAESIYTLYVAEPDRSLSDKRRADWAVKMVSVFPDLPVDNQGSLLSPGLWARIGGKVWLPLLRRLTHDALQSETSPPDGLYDLAVQRLYELAPAEGRQIILAQIRQPKPRLSLNILTHLPDTRLPQLDALLATRLEATADGDDTEVWAALVARYATEAVLPRIKKSFDGGAGHWGCSEQASLLSYFLRTDPAFGRLQINRALDRRKDTACWQSVLSDVAAHGMDPTLEKIAVARLDDPDLTIVTDAAQALGAHGSPAAESALWRRLRRLYAQWRDKPDQFRAHEKDKYIQQRPEVGLAQALATSPNWVVGPAALAEIKRLCLAPDTFTQAQVDLNSYAGKGKVPVYADILNQPGTWDDEQWRIAQYWLTSRNAVENKMAQYPRGTVFVWMSQPPSASTPRERQAFTQLQTFLTKRGMTLQVPARKP